MSLQGIVFYTGRALRFALIVELVWLLGYGVTHGGRRGLRDGLQGGRFLWSSLLVFYLAALVQITVIRGGIGVGAFWAASHDGSAVQLVPMWHTLRQARAGWWAVVYPVCGNILWFLPLGMLLPRLWPRRFASGWAVLAAAALLSVSIEVLQWLFGSGVSDVDDVLFNAAGGWLGWRWGRQFSTIKSFFGW